MKQYRTASGSLYEVDEVNKRARVLEKSRSSHTKRLGTEWRDYETMVWSGFGKPLIFVWGTGRDEHSTTADQIGTEGEPDEHVTRQTVTTPVVETKTVCS